MKPQSLMCASPQMYFYSARTREAAWTRPEGPTTRIVSQQEWEAYQTSQAQGGPAPGAAPGGGPTTAAQAAVAQGTILQYC